ncbi:MAG TPA: folylpolyglutamate synthase/dihydrofolate synthase family protein, partial [Candidatus Manganitrophaceae bacterium]
MSYAQTLDYLYRLQWHGIQPGLERMEEILSLLGRPEKGFPSVHVAGTNGKGSTAAMIASALRRGGYRIGLYTSPHLIDFSERIRVDDIPIPQEEIVRLTEFLRRRIEGEAPHLTETITFFEFTTALAFLYFAEAKVDLAVVEVGLGGRFDATNLLTPLVSVITNIDLDHEQYLGPTIVRIAEEKAGVIKERVPVVTGAAQPEVLSLFERIARSKEAPLIRLGEEIKVSGDLPARFVYRGDQERIVHCPLLGRHQIRNAALAVAALEQLRLKGIQLSEKDLLDGIADVRWEGRLEMIRKNPLIFLDGAHNPAGAETLGDFLKEIDPERSGKHW